VSLTTPEPAAPALTPPQAAMTPATHIPPVVMTPEPQSQPVPASAMAKAPAEQVMSQSTAEPEHGAALGESINGDFTSSDLISSDLVVPAHYRQIDEAITALHKGNTAPALAVLAKAEHGPNEFGVVDLAPFFLLASEVQQGLILSGLMQLDRLQPRRALPRVDTEILAGLLESASVDRAGAFIGLAAQVGGSPEFAAAMTLDLSRKLAGLALIAMGATPEDAVRFAIRLGDESAKSVPVVFGLAGTLRQINASAAQRLIKAIGGADIAITPERAGRHVPAADPSLSPQRRGTAREEIAAPRAVPLPFTRKAGEAS
jgi:hypothetical protein